MSDSSRLLFVLLGGTLSLSGCAETTEAVRPLPYHVALAVTLPEAPNTNSGSAATPDEEPPFLHFDRSQFCDDLARALQGVTFAQVSVLEEQTGPTWIDQARTETSADLLAHATLTYDTSVVIARPFRWYANIFIFLLLGPLAYWTDDVSYATRVSLELGLYELTQEEATQRERAFLDQMIKVDFDEASLDFLKRAESYKPYLYSIVVPPGFLSNRSEKARESLKNLILEKLGRELSSRIRGSPSLHINSQVASFGIEADRTSARRSADDVRLEVTLQLSAESPAPLVGYDLVAQPGDWRSTNHVIETPDGLPPEGGTYRVTEKLDVPGPARWLRLIVYDAVGQSRGFTIPIESPGPGPAS